MPERVAAVALRVVERLSVPGQQRLCAAAVQDVRSHAVFALWRAAQRDPAGFSDGDVVVEAAVIAYLSLQLRKGLDELERQQRFTPLEAWHAWGEDVTLAGVLEREAERELDAHIAQMSPAARDVVRGRRAGLSYARIAQVLRIRRNTAIQRYRRAVRRLPLDLHALLPAAYEHGC